MKILIKRAGIEDAEDILSVQKKAFLSEAKIYGRYDISPLTENAEKIKKEFSRKIFLKAVSDECIVGSIRGFCENDTCFMERLSVLPDYQGRGIGKSLMLAMEKLFGKSKRIEIAAGQKSSKNLSMYRNMGYRIISTVEVDKDLKYFHLEKKID
jgi:ribosomal protein S18 acetylase RimI-like enzyme